MKTLREHSCKNFLTDSTCNQPTVAEINCGSLQRIADAIEKMAANYDDLQKDRDHWKSTATLRWLDIKHKKHVIVGLKGAFTHLKKKAEAH